MKLAEEEVLVPIAPGHKNIIQHIRKALEFRLADRALPTRFSMSRVENEQYYCEFGTLEEADFSSRKRPSSIFEFNHRKFERTDGFNVVFLVPTGIGAEIGGHAGDATPTVRAIANACDTLITHPNAVNASDINEMPENALYVEGSVLTRLLAGTIGLQRVRSNRVLMILEDHETELFTNAAINSINAARATYGLSCSGVIKLRPMLHMTSGYTENGRATGTVEGLDTICSILDEYDGAFDAVGIASIIDVPPEFHSRYFKSDGKMVNPWGGVEAQLTHALSQIYEIPTAHSPMLESREVAEFDPGLVEPRLAAEAVSLTFLQCMLKGLHRSPRLVTDSESICAPGIISAADVSCLVIPDKCVGLPTLAALEQGIPVIAVKENNNLMENDLRMLPWADDQLHIVDNYWEAIGVLTCLKAGVSPSSLRRPLPNLDIVAKDLGAAEQTDAALPISLEVSQKN